MKNIVVGIDIGGTNTIAGVVRSNGEILARGKISTKKHGANLDAYLTDLGDLIRQLVIESGDVQLVGIGIGAPNGNFHKGTIEQAPNLDWKGTVALCELLSRQFTKIPIQLTNDANAAAMGEKLFGAAKGIDDFVTITLGTGVGSGVVCNGQLVYGHDGFAGEIGHTTVYPGGRFCGCGRQGCLEAYLSASGLVKTAFELLVKFRTPSVLESIPMNKMTSKDIFDAAQKGDFIASEVFKISAETMGLKLADIVATTSPKAIFIVGGVAQAGDLLLNPIKQSLEKHVLGIYKGKVDILPSGLPGIDVAILGSAALIWRIIG